MVPWEPFREPIRVSSRTSAFGCTRAEAGPGESGCDRKNLGEPQAGALVDSIRRLLEQLEHRPIYRTLDVITLARLANNKVELAIVDYAHTRVESQCAEEAAIVASLPGGVRAVYLTWGLEVELLNGGFSRYYRSPLGRYAQETVAAFEFFAAHQHARLLREASRIRAEEKALGDPEDEPSFESFFEPYEMSRLHWLDDEFYKLEESLSKLRIAKIRREPWLFLDSLAR